MWKEKLTRLGCFNWFMASYL